MPDGDIANGLKRKRGFCAMRKGRRGDTQGRSARISAVRQPAPGRKEKRRLTRQCVNSAETAESAHSRGAIYATP